MLLFGLSWVENLTALAVPSALATTLIAVFRTPSQAPLTVSASPYCYIIHDQLIEAFAVGSWFEAYFEMLVTNANPPFTV